jgi:hypothetical protein
MSILIGNSLQSDLISQTHLASFPLPGEEAPVAGAAPPPATVTTFTKGRSMSSGMVLGPKYAKAMEALKEASKPKIAIRATRVVVPAGLMVPARPMEPARP